jgi:hypothetical protein
MPIHGRESVLTVQMKYVSLLWLNSVASGLNKKPSDDSDRQMHNKKQGDLSNPYYSIPTTADCDRSRARTDLHIKIFPADQ